MTQAIAMPIATKINVMLAPVSHPLSDDNYRWRKLTCGFGLAQASEEPSHIRPE